MTFSDTTVAIEVLTPMLAHELSAVESCFRALELALPGALRQQLRECQRSHQLRVDALRARLIQLGDDPAPSAGPWTVFSDAAADGSLRSMLAALVEGERLGDHYRREIDDADTARFVAATLLPEHERTLELVETLRATYSG